PIPIALDLSNLASLLCRFIALQSFALRTFALDKDIRRRSDQPTQLSPPELVQFSTWKQICPSLKTVSLFEGTPSTA
ncbi:hypothetical protein FRC12_016106, partial [Ceratobasidium sp. 428]